MTKRNGTDMELMNMIASKFKNKYIPWFFFVEIVFLITMVGCTGNSESTINRNWDDTEEMVAYEADGAGFDLTYTGYLDIHPVYAEENPRQDFDGDGQLDRVYKQYDEEDGTSLYVHFYNGKELLLTSSAWGVWFHTTSCDVTGDGVNEIVFCQESMSTGGLYMTLSIFQQIKDEWVQMEIPFCHSDDAEKNLTDGMELYLPLMLTKADDHQIILNQPDTGFETTIYPDYDEETGWDEMEHFNISDEPALEDYRASEYSIVDIAGSNQKAIQMVSYLGDKWVVAPVFWTIVYQDYSWTISKIGLSG